MVNSGTTVSGVEVPWIWRVQLCSEMRLMASALGSDETGSHFTKEMVPPPILDWTPEGKVERRVELDRRQLRKPSRFVGAADNERGLGAGESRGRFNSIEEEVHGRRCAVLARMMHFYYRGRALPPTHHQHVHCLPVRDSSTPPSSFLHLPTLASSIRPRGKWPARCQTKARVVPHPRRTRLPAFATCPSRPAPPPSAMSHPQCSPPSLSVRLLHVHSVSSACLIR